MIAPRLGATIRLFLADSGPYIEHLPLGRLSPQVLPRRQFGKLREVRLEPSPACDDATFLRRASLDLTGALPGP